MLCGKQNGELQMPVEPTRESEKPIEPMDEALHPRRHRATSKHPPTEVEQEDSWKRDRSEHAQGVLAILIQANVSNVWRSHVKTSVRDTTGLCGRAK